MTTQEYLGWFDDVVAPTERMVRLVEEGFLDWKPTERSFSIGQLIAHLPLALGFNAQVLRRQDGLPTIREIFVRNRRHPTVSVEESMRMLAANIADFKKAVSAYSDNEFQTMMISTPQKGNVRVWRFCAFVLEHHIHHLMELHLSLKILGVPVDTRTLYSGD